MTTQSSRKVSLWRDERFIKIAFQLGVLVILIAILAVLIGNLNQNMQRQGMQFGYSFLQNAAGFSISESIIPYRASDPYLQVMLAGLVNSLRVMISGIILTTIVGVAAGIASFSENWLLRKISFFYVEIVRNTPLLLQLFFWYFAVFSALPDVRTPGTIFGSIYLSKQGVVIPWLGDTPLVGVSLGLIVACAIAAFLIWRWRIKLMVTEGASGKPQLIALGVIGIVALLLFLFGLNWQFPQSPEPGIIRGGLPLSREFFALLAGLVFYTGAFIAEIVRAGIQSVAKGQWEAARSLGLKSGLVMRLVIFPQAMRVIIPPLNSQYMNLAKNSSLAVAVGFPDFYSNALTTLNTTGRAIEVFSIILSTYLIIDLIISLGMNFLNKAVQLQER